MTKCLLYDLNRIDNYAPISLCFICYEWNQPWWQHQHVMHCTKIGSNTILRRLVLAHRLVPPIRHIVIAVRIRYVAQPLHRAFMRSANWVWAWRWLGECTWHQTAARRGGRVCGTTPHQAGRPAHWSRVRAQRQVCRVHCHFHHCAWQQV